MNEKTVREAFKAYAADNYFEPSHGEDEDKSLNWSWCDRSIGCVFKEHELAYVFMIDMEAKTTTQGKLETGEDFQRLWDWLMEQTPGMPKKPTIKKEKVKLRVKTLGVGGTQRVLAVDVYVSAELQSNTKRKATDLAEQIFLNMVAKDQHVRGVSEGQPTLVFLGQGDTVQVLTSDVVEES